MTSESLETKSAQFRSLETENEYLRNKLDEYRKSAGMWEETRGSIKVFFLKAERKGEREWKEVKMEKEMGGGKKRST